MHGLELVDPHQWNFGSFIGLTHDFFTLNITTLTSTWVAMAILTIGALTCRHLAHSPDSFLRFIVLKIGRLFIDFGAQASEHFSLTITSFVTTAFLFILACNFISIVPGFEKEPTADLNTTLALSVITFLYVQWASISAKGLKAYLKGFFSPFFLMMPLNVMGKLTPVISLAFRLFGNIFGGSIIVSIYLTLLKRYWVYEVLGLITGLNLVVMLFFNIFEGFLQAFVFATLSATYLALAIQGDGH